MHQTFLFPASRFSLCCSSDRFDKGINFSNLSISLCAISICFRTRTSCLFSWARDCLSSCILSWFSAWNFFVVVINDNDDEIDKSTLCYDFHYSVLKRWLPRHSSKLSSFWLLTNRNCGVLDFPGPVVSKVTSNVTPPFASTTVDCCTVPYASVSSVSDTPTLLRLAKQLWMRPIIFLLVFLTNVANICDIIIRDVNDYDVNISLILVDVITSYPCLAESKVFINDLMIVLYESKILYMYI